MNAPGLLRTLLADTRGRPAPSGLYGWIRSNDSRSMLLFLAFAVAIQVICAVNLFLPLAIADPHHAPFLDWGGYMGRYAALVLAASFLWFAAEMFWHVETVRRTLGFRFVDARDEPRLCRTIEPLILAIGLPPPFVAILESPARNAFACGIVRTKAVVVVTRGLLEALTDQELACVLAHELSHIRNGDIRLMAAANICLARLRLLHRNNALQFTPVHAMLAIAVPVVLPLTLAGTVLGHLVLRSGQVARLLIGASREYIADGQAVELTKDPAALASALVKVEQHHEIAGAGPGEDAMMIAGQCEGEEATHPTIAQRIEALARTTGSMVFIAPGALPASAWESSPALAAAKAGALLRSGHRTDALRRVRAGSDAGLLGMTRGRWLMTAAALAGLLWIHAGELDEPRAIAAKFDIRPLSLILGGSVACELPVTAAAAARCRESLAPDAYRQFEGQKNTLAGWLAEMSRKERSRGPSERQQSFGG